MNMNAYLGYQDPLANMVYASVPVSVTVEEHSTSAEEEQEQEQEDDIEEAVGETEELHQMLGIMGLQKYLSQADLKQHIQKKNEQRFNKMIEDMEKKYQKKGRGNEEEEEEEDDEDDENDEKLRRKRAPRKFSPYSKLPLPVLPTQTTSVKSFHSSVNPFANPVADPFSFGYNFS